MNVSTILRRLLFLAAGVMLFQFSFAQTPTSFPDSDEEFIKAFGDYVGKSKRQESIDAGAAFAGVYNGLDGSVKSIVRETANEMLAKKVRNYPVFMDYVNAVSLVVAGKSQGVTQDHIKALRDLIVASNASSYKQFEKYIEYLPTLINERALSLTNTRSWKFSGENNYKVSVIEGRAALHFNSTDITGSTKNDTLIFYGTSGIYFPVDEIWQGKNGKYLFSRAGYGEADVKVELGSYEMDLNKSDFHFDSVYFSMPKHIQGRIMGQMDEKIYSSSPQTVSYPKFSSYSVDINIINVDERMTTSGGFELAGGKMVIKGEAGSLAKISLATGGKEQVSAMSLRFIVDPEDKEVTSENAAISLYMKKDSLYHPSLIFKYDTETNTLALDKRDGITSGIPFSSGYHRMTMNFNSILWKLDDPDITFRTVSTYTSDPVSFTSFNHYIPQGELKYLTLTGRNPLQMIKELADSYGTNDITGYDIAGMMGYPLKEIENVLYKLTKDGFIYYDPETKRVRVDYKTHHYIDAGKALIDYDHIQFVSAPRGNVVNGYINTDSQTLVIKGVNKFDLSTSKRVTLEPRNSDVVLSEDRDLEMEGRLTAGKLLFKGKGMHFDYEGFKVDMQSVDSLVIFVTGDENPYGEFESVPLRSVISDIKGTLYVDDPGNKSGLYNYPEYPYFTSYDTAYVYFDTEYDSVRFPRDKFYFQIYPFTLEDISRIITDSLTFKGRMVTNDIFTPFETVLSVQKDRTLGLDEITPTAGLDLYKANGRFFNNYKLTKNGLFGDGRIEYRQATMFSHKFDFYGDSVIARLDTLTISPSAEADAPQLMTNGRTDAVWYPYNDELVVNSGKRSFSMYDNALDYDGNLRYTAGVLNGTSDSAAVSNYRIDRSLVQAVTGTFGHRGFTADDAVVNIFKESSSDPEITVSHVVPRVDFDSSLMNVSTLYDTVITHIPGTFLQTDTRAFTWDWSGNNVVFRNDETLSRVFTSTLPAYDSLQFTALEAVLDLESDQLKAIDVSHINLADSKLVPPDKILTIQKDGTFLPMENATLIMNSDEEFHTLKDVSVVVRSKNDFGGTGKYTYQRRGADPYDVSIDEIRVKTDTLNPDKKKIEASDLGHYVTARGVIPEEDGFRLDDQVFYKGNIYMSSKDKEIGFEGFARIDLKQNEESSWFNMNQGVDPENFRIGIDSLVNEYKQKVVAGLYVSPGEFEVYPAIMNPKRSSQDPVLYQATGALFKGEGQGEYLFGTQDAVNGSDPAGTVLRYNDNSGVVEIDGAVSWSTDIPLVKGDGFGYVKYDPATRSAAGTSVIGIDFPMDLSIWYKFARDVADYNYEAKKLDYNRPEIKRALRYFVKDAGAASTIISDIETANLFKLPAGFPYKILLTDVNLSWDPVDGNFKSVEPIGLCSVDGYPVDLQIKAYTEFGYNMGSNYMNLYLETSSGEWYFFSTKRGKMFVISSDQSFNDAVVNSENKEVTEGKKGPVIYEFLPGNLTGKMTFIQRVEDYIARTTGQETEE